LVVLVEEALEKLQVQQQLQVVQLIPVVVVVDQVEHRNVILAPGGSGIVIIAYPIINN
jgi:hypothetical protein